MRIRKQYQVIPTNALLENEHSTSDKNGYTCEYINKISDYSTTEQVIGRWIDGKPLYRKSYNFGSLPNNSSKSMNLEIDNLDLITNINAIAKNIGGTIIPIPTISTSSSGLITLYISGNTLYITTGEDRTAYNCYITLEYTKTTD